MRKVVIGDRTIVVTHVETKTTEFGEIQRFRIEASGSKAVTHLSSLRPSTEVDARVLASVVDTELLLDYTGSSESGLLSDIGIRRWRDTHRQLIEDALERLREEALALAPVPTSDVERSLLRAFGVPDNDPGSRAPESSDPSLTWRVRS